jgi:hypothetical protein
MARDCKFKQCTGNNLTTLFPRQGHYALDQQRIAAYPPACITIEHIGDLPEFDLSGIFGIARSRHAERLNHE